MASRTASFWTFIAILVVLHLVLRLAFGIEFVPDLLVVAALLGGRRLGGWQAALFGLLLGVLADSLALIGFGASSVAFVIVCYLASRSRSLFEEGYLFVAFYAFFGAWLVEVIRFATGGPMAASADAGYLISGAPMNALWITVAAIVSLMVYRAVTGYR